MFAKASAMCNGIIADQTLNPVGGTSLFCEAQVGFTDARGRNGRMR
jgi:hypothetical protein